MNKKVGFLAVGQCGSNVVSGFEAMGYNAFYLNTSKEDLSTLVNAKHTYHLYGSDGCNKNREKAKTVLANNIENVLTEINTKLTEEIIFVAFSTGGGTGSGISPTLIEILSQETNKTICVIGVLPSESESFKAHLNAYECCRELADIENIGCSFFLDNSKMQNKFTINSIFVDLLNSILTNNATSTKGNVDIAEITEMIKTKGMSIISKLGKYKAQTPKLIETFKQNIFAPMEADRTLKYIGLINSTDDINVNDICKEVGTPLDVFQGYDSPVTIALLSGLTYPFTRLIQIRDKVQKNQDTIAKSLQATSLNKLTDDINFLNDVVVKKAETKKVSSRDLLMKFKTA